MYQRIYNNLQDIYYFTDTNGFLLKISPSVKNCLGYNEDELIGKSILDLYYNKEDRKYFLKNLEEKEYVNDITIEFRHKNGKKLFYSVSAHIVKDQNGINGIEGILRDITNRKYLELERENVILKLQKKLKTVIKKKKIAIICANCGKIKDENGYWVKIEDYLREKYGIEFSHSICMKCAYELYPDFYKYLKIGNKQF